MGSEVVFAREPYSLGLVNEMLPLWAEHWKEIASETFGPLEPNLEFYETLDKYGVLRIYTVRNEGKLIGYQIFNVAMSPMSKNMLTSNSSLIYITPDERKGLLAKRFLDFCTNQLSIDGVQVVYMSISADHKLKSLLERSGFRHVDQIYCKKLSEVKNNG